MITAICNVYINSEEKFELFKETFPLVYSISDNWLIYIRGKFRKNVISFIKAHKNTKQNCVFFTNLFDNDWVKSTKKMLEKAKYDYVYVFLEDHFLLKSLIHFKQVISEAIDTGIDYFQYSAHKIGVPSNNSEILFPDHTKFFFTYKFSKNKLYELRKLFPRFYPFALISVCKIEYLNKILSLENKFSFTIPTLLQVIMEKLGIYYPNNRRLVFSLNKILSIINVKLRLYPLSTPFNLERSLFDIEENLLPIRVGILREELFANWDDDNGFDDSSMIKRGLYPLSLKVSNYNDIKFNRKKKQYKLSKGSTSKHRFYPNISRQKNIPLKYIKLIDGRITISSNKESYNLLPGDYIVIAANIEHYIHANLDSKYIVKLKY